MNRFKAQPKMRVGRPLLPSLVQGWLCRCWPWGFSSGEGSSFWNQSSSHQDPTIIKPCICWATLSSLLKFFSEYQHVSEKSQFLQSLWKHSCGKLGAAPLWVLFATGLSPINWICRKKREKTAAPMPTLAPTYPRLHNLSLHVRGHLTLGLFSLAQRLTQEKPKCN